MRELHFDYETYSPVDLKACGVYRYAEEAEIILITYSLDGQPVVCVDVLSGDPIPGEFLQALEDRGVMKYAFNAMFERVISRACLGVTIPTDRIRCTMVWAASLGLPRGLDKLSEVLKLGDKGKLKVGKQLIRKFCSPRKPTKKNPDTRLMPDKAPEDWALFKQYAVNDVVAEMAAHEKLLPYPMREQDWVMYARDQEINDRGIAIDAKLVRNAIEVSERQREQLIAQAKEITGLENPNSRDQLIRWLDSEDVVTTTLTKKDVQQIIGSTDNEKVLALLEIRQQIAKASIKKYLAIARSVCRDGRLRGTLLYYGAGTGRWSGAILQPQNLPSKGLIENIPMAREILRDHPDSLEMLYGDTARVLSSLIRPALVPEPGHVYAVADFSAIEGRIVGWLAHEQWRIDLFAAGGKLYETSAEKMFGLPPGSVKKGDPNRDKGKVSELALGYQGWEGSLITMGALDMGLTLEELAPLAQAWRDANPAIVAWWAACERTALEVMRTRKRLPVLTEYQQKSFVHYEFDGRILFCELPSGRRLAYAAPKIARNSRGRLAVRYMGIDSDTKRWSEQWLYGGLMLENQAQAIAADALAEVLLSDVGRFAVLHVHDEVIAEVPEAVGPAFLNKLEGQMALPLEWAPGLLLKGDGYLTPFYVKED